MYLVDSVPTKFHPIVPTQQKPEVESVRERLGKLDLEMERVLHDQSLDDEEKLYRYLRTLREHIMSTRRMERLIGEPLPVRITDDNTNGKASKEMKIRKKKKDDSPKHTSLLGDILSTASPVIPKSPSSDMTPHSSSSATPMKMVTTPVQKDDFSEDEEEDDDERYQSMIEAPTGGQVVERLISPATTYDTATTESTFTRDNLIRQMPQRKMQDTQALLDTMLKSTFGGKYLGWNEISGDLIIDGKTLRGSNIVDHLRLLLRNQNRPRDQPHGYDQFLRLVQQKFPERFATAIQPQQQQQQGTGGGARMAAVTSSWLNY
jgi:hypothetical protein